MRGQSDTPRASALAQDFASSLAVLDIVRDIALLARLGKGKHGRFHVATASSHPATFQERVFGRRQQQPQPLVPSPPFYEPTPASEVVGPSSPSPPLAVAADGPVDGSSPRSQLFGHVLRSASLTSPPLSAGSSGDGSGGGSCGSSGRRQSSTSAALLGKFVSPQIASPAKEPLPV